MKFRLLPCLFAFVLPMAAFAAEEAAAPPPTRSFWDRVRHPFGGSKPQEPKVRGTNFRQLEVALLVDPNPVKLADNRQLKVTLTLTNKGGKLAQLDFPTSQRVEVLLKAKDGKTIEQWSQDQAFTNEPTAVTINPRERLEYTVNVATRDLTAGETYVVEAFFPNFDALRKSVSLATEK